MAGNAAPIFSRAGLLSSATITNAATALTTSNGAAATGITTAAGEMFIVATGDATNGSFIQKIKLRSVASAANTATTSLTVRFYISTISSGATTNADTYNFEEIVMGVQTAAATSATTNGYEIPCNFILPAGKYILASVHQKPATNTEAHIFCFGGNY